MVHGLETLRALNEKRCQQVRESESKKSLKKVVEISGLDISSCMVCGCLVICVPYGTPLCKTCSDRLQHDA